MKCCNKVPWFLLQILDSDIVVCFVGVDDFETVMHSVSSTECDLNIRACTNLEDFYMLGKLAKGDLFAQDAVYHQVLQEKRSESKTSQSELEVIARAKTWHSGPYLCLFPVARKPPPPSLPTIFKWSLCLT